MLRRSLILITGILFVWTATVFAQNAPSLKNVKKVFAENGYIYYSPDGKKKIQLTRHGNDEAPVLSPDDKRVAFLRKSEKEAYLAVGSPEDYLQSGPDGILADQVWIVDIDGKDEKLLARDNNPDELAVDMEFDGSKVIAHIEEVSLQFSPDSKKVYFISSAWVTSGALHSVNIDGSDERFVAASNYLKVIDKGEYKGNLIIQQHRYFLTRGSYGRYYVFSPEGKELAVLADNLDSVNWDFLYYFEDE